MTIVNYIPNWPTSAAALCPKCQQQSWSVHYIPTGTNLNGTVTTEDLLTCACGVCGYNFYMKTAT